MGRSAIGAGWEKLRPLSVERLNQMVCPLPKTSATVPSDAASCGWRFGTVVSTGMRRIARRMERVRIISEPQPQSQLNDSRIVDGRNLPETGQRICRVCSRAERAVQRQVVSAIERVERLGHCFQPPALSDRE